MDTRGKLAKGGAWLFCFRSHLPVLLLSVIIPALIHFSYPFGSHLYDVVWEMFCLMISFLGLFIRACTVGYASKATSGSNTRRQVAASLNRTGLYAATRNPLYLRNFFMMLGVIMFARHVWLILIFACLFWLYYERIILAEETFLLEKFGKEYEQYLIDTPVFIPDIRLWQKPDLPFSLKTVLKREYSGFFAVIAAFTAVEFIGDYFVEGRIVFDPMWIAIFFFGLAVYILLRMVKKRTRFFHVDGR